MTAELSITAVLGVLVPIVVAIITKVSTSGKVKGLLALGLAAVLGLGMAAFSGGFVWTGDLVTNLWVVVRFVGLALVSAQANYNMWIKPTGLATYVQENIGLTD